MKSLFSLVYHAAAAAALSMMALPAGAQTRSEPTPELPPAQIDAGGSVGQLPASPIGQVGQRQTSDHAGPNIAPGARIEERINNRVASRLNTRISDGYRSQADALSAYGAANEETASANRKIRR